MSIPLEGLSYLWNTGESTDFIIVALDSSLMISVSVNYNSNINSCSFSDTILLTVLEEVDTTYLELTTCDSLIVGIMEFAFTTQNGCDSIVIETTSFIPIPDVPIVPADLVIQEGEAPFQVTVPEVLNATEYVWTVPTGVDILSGQGTNVITVDWNGLATGGLICISALNECGSSTADCVGITVDFTDGLEEIKNKGYSIFPNPADDYLNVISEKEELYEIVLLDALGRIVVHSLEYVGQAEINIRTLTSGTYWLKMKNNEQVFWEQVEVVRR